MLGFQFYAVRRFYRAAVDLAAGTAFHRRRAGSSRSTLARMSLLKVLLAHTHHRVLPEATSVRYRRRNATTEPGDVGAAFPLDS